MQTSVSAVDRAIAEIEEELGRHRRLPSPSERRAIREQSGLSTGWLAKAMGVTSQTVRNYESGRRTPHGERLEIYLAVLDAIRRVAA
jgi:DNA-binding transcriptional regulator YiaG